MIRPAACVFRPVRLMLVLVLLLALPAHATILWSDPDSRLVHNTGPGVDILGGSVQRGSKDRDALYFRVHVDPLSDAASEPYFAGIQLFEGDQERLGMGNAMEAWGYSAFNTAEMGPSNVVAGEFNLSSAHPEKYRLGISLPYELVRHDVERTIIFKVQFVPGEDAIVTAWLDPDLGRGGHHR